MWLTESTPDPEGLGARSGGPAAASSALGRGAPPPPQVPCLVTNKEEASSRLSASQPPGALGGRRPACWASRAPVGVRGRPPSAPTGPARTRHVSVPVRAVRGGAFAVGSVTVEGRCRPPAASCPPCRCRERGSPPGEPRSRGPWPRRDSAAGEWPGAGPASLLGTALVLAHLEAPSALRLCGHGPRGSLLRVRPSPPPAFSSFSRIPHSFSAPPSPPPSHLAHRAFLRH